MSATTRLTILLAIVCSAALASEVSADSQINTKVDGAAILAQADLARGDPQGVVWDVVVEAKEGGKRSLARYHVKSREYNSLVDFVEPAKSRGNKLLMVDRNMWFYKPGLFKAVPISPRQRLMGNASNGDLASTNYASDYAIEGMSEGEVNGERAYVFDLHAVQKRATYDRVRYWVSASRKLGIKAEFYTVSGNLMKTAVFEYNNTAKSGSTTRPFISKMIIKDPHRANDVTVLHIGNVRLEKITDAVFNLNLITR